VEILNIENASGSDALNAQNKKLRRDIKWHKRRSTKNRKERQDLEINHRVLTLKRRTKFNAAQMISSFQERRNLPEDVTPLYI
jgi:hypothetical protein